MSTDGIYHQILLRRIADGEANAYREFGVAYGLIIRRLILERGVPVDEAEIMACDCVDRAFDRIARSTPGISDFDDLIRKLVADAVTGWQNRHDLLDAAEIQRLMMPVRKPQVTGMDACFDFRAARFVTGDFCTIQPTPNGVAISLGDAMGKGARAAIYGGNAHAWLKATPDRDCPSCVLRGLDCFLRDLGPDPEPIAMLQATWQPSLSELRLAAGGAPEPWLVQNLRISRLSSPGRLIGVSLPAAARTALGDFETSTFSVKSGDLLVLCSDGIPDQPNEEGILYGDGRMNSVLADVAMENSEAVIGTLMDDIERFRGSCGQQDDQMILAMRVV
jgi:serine phosphatase RsbU (regulator of sigma subunit)